MMYLTGLPTSDNSFYRKSAMVADLNRRDLFEDTDLVGRLREDKMKYIFVIDDLRYHQFLWDLFKTGGFPLVREGFEGGRRLKLWDVDEMERHAWYRLLTTNKIPSGLKLLFGMNVQKTSYQYENLKVFEVLPK